MGRDEPAAIEAVQGLWHVFRDVVPRHGGSLDVFKGDCFLATFPSAVDAVRAALEIQERIARRSDEPHEELRVKVRIGIHLGEVVRTEGGQLFGDSINIAARVQAIAHPGGVGMTDDVYRAVRNKMRGVEFRDQGLKTFKNIRDPMRVYYAGSDAEEGARPPATPPAEEPARRTGRAPRYAVLGGALLAVIVAGLIYVRPDLPGIANPRGGTPTPLVVGVMGMRARGGAPTWMRDLTRDALNTIFSRVAGLRVYSKEKIDFLCEKRGLSEIEAAETLGVNKMVSGTLALAGSRVVLELRIVDIQSGGLLDAAEEVTGTTDQLVELQNTIAQRALARLHIHLTDEEQKDIFARRTNETLESYKLLSEVLGVFAEDTGDQPEPRTRRNDLGTWLRALLVTPANAEEQSSDEAAIRALLEQYRLAFQAKDVDALALVSVSMNETQRSALERFFENVQNLTVGIADVDLLIEGNEALATFTRRDLFRDTRSGRDVELEIRMSSILAKVDGDWKIKGLKKPS
jgi:TolB-like protein/ketosteroid isomerase-like protein